MLQELRVKNLGIIEDLEWKLDAGMNVITGETGAGKSLIIDAVELLLNGSAAEDVIRHGCAEARIEGVFAISEPERYAYLKSFLDDKGLAPEDDTLIISYDLKKQKPGQARINSRVVTRTILRQVGRLLIDIHGQSQHLSLLDEHAHLEFLDGFAKTGPLKTGFSVQVAKLKSLESELAEMQSKEEATTRQQDFLRYQIEEIRKADLHDGEDEELEKERHLITHAEKLKEQAVQVHQILSQSDSSGYAPSVIAGLQQALKSLRRLSELDPAVAPQLEGLEKAFYTIEEGARELNAYAEKLDFDPRRLEEVENRLELIRGLKRKFGHTLGEIIAYRDQAQRDLDLLDSSQERQLAVRHDIAAAKIAAGQVGAELSQARSIAAQRLAENMKIELNDLEMGQMDFCVSVTRTPSEQGIPAVDGVLYAFNPDGIDKVEFLVSTNPGEPLKPLAKIASTGEISRFTLALKGALAEADRVPVLIFDEIDIGVGGRSGEIVGKKLWGLARHHQVVCVTHLPQIAAYADAHYFVRKEISGERTVSALESLNAESRLKETALMLAGPGYSAAALKSARELLTNASNWKKGLNAAQGPAQLKF